MNRAVALYQKVAKEFAERAIRELDGEIQAIVLYGSVARGQATNRSDIDILVVSPFKDRIRTKVVELEDEINFENNYDTFLTSNYFTLEEVKNLTNKGSPYLLEVLKEGIILYDDGSFARLREEVLGASRRNAGGRKAYAPEPTP